MTAQPVGNFGGTWLRLESGPGQPAWNMAVDEVLLEAASEQAGPVLRFYSWTSPAATFGYFQAYARVAALTKLRPLIRRPTGGGLVPHEADWTYSLVFPPSHGWYRLRALESYRHLHQWIRLAFVELGIEPDLAPHPCKTQPGQCFAGPERFDLVWAGTKIAGAAQRRTRQGLLIQGSIQPAAGWDRAAWQAALCKVAQRMWGVVWLPWQLPDRWLARAQQLADSKYSRIDYNQGR